MVMTIGSQQSGASEFLEDETDSKVVYTTKLNDPDEDYSSATRPNMNRAQSCPVQKNSVDQMRERIRFTVTQSRRFTMAHVFDYGPQTDRKNDPPVPWRYLIVFIVLEILRNIILLKFAGWQRWILFAPIMLLLMTHIWDTVKWLRQQEKFEYWYEHQIWKDALSHHSCLTVASLVVFFAFAYLIAILIRILQVINEDETALESNFHYYIAAEGVIYMLFFILEVDYFVAFDKIQQKMKPIVDKYKLRIVLIVFILLFSISLVITLNLSDSEEEDRIIHDSYFDGFEVFGVFICFLMCVMLALINWDLISFQIANNDWVLAFIYFTFFGWIFMVVARWLHPPTIYTKVTWAWHQEPKDLSKTVHLMIMLAVLGTFLLPFGAGILLATFAEMANAMSGGGNGISGGVAVIIVIAFLIIAHFMMVNPAAGASMIDMCGGFIFVPIFMDAWKMGFGSALVLTQAILLLSHFTGSSLQWWLGKKPKVQAWLNRITPVIVLAVLDSTLREANWFQVGLIGGVFPDTINGFNQGRINMEFWTQFWSEWSALPNAAVMILNGAVLSQPNTSLLTLLPVFVVVAVMVNVVGAFYATRALYQNIGAPTYLCSVSKWTTVQYMQQRYGVVPMKAGWEKDVYDMTTPGGLFETTLPIQLARNEHLKEIENDPKSNKDLTEFYETQYFEVLQKHLDKLNDKKEESLMSDLLYCDPEIITHEKESEWTAASLIDKNGKKKKEVPREFYFQLLYLLFLYITFGISAVVFRVALEDTVQGGFKQIAENKYYPYGIAALILHFMAAAMYFRESLVPCWHTVVWFFGIMKQKVTCQDTDNNTVDVETDFKTPVWKNIGNDFSDEAKTYIDMAKKKFPRSSKILVDQDLPSVQKRQKRQMYSKSETDIPNLNLEQSGSSKPMSDATQLSDWTLQSSSSPTGVQIDTPPETPAAGHDIESKTKICQADKFAKLEQAPENFYDLLFSSSHLKVSFWKHKKALKTKVPNGFDLEEMGEGDLCDIIRSRGIRKRILTEALKLIHCIRNERTVTVEENKLVNGDNIDSIDADTVHEGDNLDNASHATTPEIAATPGSDNDSAIAATPGSDVHEDGLREEAPIKQEKVGRKTSSQPVHSEDEVFDPPAKRDLQFSDSYIKTQSNAILNDGVE